MSTTSTNPPAAWSARQYSTFEKERTRPVRDLVTAIDRDDATLAADLGCGPGNSTEVLAARFPGATIVGLDNSEDMIATARQRMPATRFELVDIAAWDPTERYDVILANASLQWVPDHPLLYPRLASFLSPGGSLAIQTPDNLSEPPHVLARETAKSGSWSGMIGNVEPPRRWPLEDYYAMLKPCCSHVDMWRTTYYHPLADAQAVVEWFKGSALRPFLAPLDAGQKQDFLAAYKAAIETAFPPQADGTVLLPFPRLFIVATR